MLNEKKPISKGYTVCDFIYIIFMNNITVAMENRLVVARC